MTSAAICASRIEGPFVGHMDATEYHADQAPEPSLSSTLAKALLKKSPLHAWCLSRRLNPAYVSIDKKTFDIGRAAHRAVLGAGDDYVAVPESLLASNGAISTKEARQFVAEAREAGQTPLKQAECDAIEEMAIVARDRLREHGVVLRPERSEIAAIAQVDDVWCRAMFDNIDDDPAIPIYDFKTCEDASPDACLRSVLNYGYDVQAAHYQAVWKAATGESREFTFIFQEKSAPFEVCLVRMSASFSDLANMRAAKARRIWGECLRADNWPGYPIGVHEIDPPAWLVEKENY